MDTNKTGKFLQDLRKENNITQEQLGEQLGVTNKTISRWETGSYIPPVDILLRLSEIYNVTVNELLSGERLTTADYQKKAEENFVISLKDTSTAKKRSKIFSIILSVICALFFIGIGCFSAYGFAQLFGFQKEYVWEDLTYKKFGSGNDMFVRVTGLSAQGTTKEVIVIPETIEGLRVSSIGVSPLGGNVHEQNFKSKYLKKIYLANANIFCESNAFQDCTNLTQVIVIKVQEEDYLNLDGGFFVYNSSRTRCRTVPLYLYKEIYEIRSHRWAEWVFESGIYAVANVTYYYNYFGTPNGDCYWLDQVEAGDKIEYIPPEPIRSSNRYKFDGWYTEKECINKWDFASNVMPTTGELNLYAKWIENNN